MKILFVTTISPTIGFLIPQIKFLIEQGHRVDVAFNVVKEVRPELIEFKCKINDIKFQRSPFAKENFNAYKKMRKLVLDEGYELIHTHTPIASFITRMACRNIPNLKMIYTAHGFHFFKKSPLKSWLIYYPMEKLASRWTDGLITMNEEDFLAAKKMNIRQRDSVFKVNGVGVDLHNFPPQTAKEKSSLRKEYMYRSDDFILFYAAELNFNKHQDLLIDAIKILKEKIPNIKLLLAGNGKFEERYEQRIRNLGLEENVKLLGLRRDISNLLKISDIAVASSRREGLPVNIMEAMASGLPIVATNTRGHVDLINDGENGFTVDIDDPKSFADAIEEIYRSEIIRERFKVNNLKVVKRYAIENVINEMKDIYSGYLR